MAVFKHTFSGPGPAGDIWSTGFHTSGPISDITTMHNAYEIALDDALHAGVLAQWAPGTRVTDLTTYKLDETTGHSTSVARSSVLWVGTSAGAQGGPRDCAVVGLRTVVPGPGGRGRMFLPAPAVTNLTSTGLLSLTTRTAIADAIAGMISALHLLPAMAGRWRPGLSFVEPFRQVTVGVVMGSQRRRSNKIPNSYYVAATT